MSAWLKQFAVFFMSLGAGAAIAFGVAWLLHFVWAAAAQWVFWIIFGWWAWIGWVYVSRRSRSGISEGA